jgi:hypothetical protein
MATCQHEEETYYFPCNNPIPGSKAVFFPKQILLLTLCQDKDLILKPYLTLNIYVETGIIKLLRKAC